MKKIIILFIILSVREAYPQSGWYWVNPLPQGNNLNSVFVWGYDSLICVGDAGSIIKTTNGGSFTGPGAGTAISIRLETLDLYDTPIQTFVTASYPSSSDGWLEISADGSITHDKDIMIQARVKVYAKSGYSGYFDSVVVEEL